MPASTRRAGRSRYTYSLTKVLRHEHDLPRRLTRGDHRKRVVRARERQALRRRYVRVDTTLDPPVDQLTRLRWRR